MTTLGFTLGFTGDVTPNGASSVWLFRATATWAFTGGTDPDGASSIWEADRFLGTESEDFFGQHSRGCKDAKESAAADSTKLSKSMHPRILADDESAAADSRDAQSAAADWKTRSSGPLGRVCQPRTLLPITVGNTNGDCPNNASRFPSRSTALVTALTFACALPCP